MWMMTLPVLSTAHVSPETLADLCFQYSELHDDLGLIASYDAGVFVSIGEDENFDGLPEDLVAVFRWATRNGYAWVRLDADGDVIPELLTFEHH